ncbi:unnamed protein product, partial [Rotaria magnacalcarata]
MVAIITSDIIIDFSVQYDQLLPEYDVSDKRDDDHYVYDTKPIS